MATNALFSLIAALARIVGFLAAPMVAIVSPRVSRVYPREIPADICRLVKELAIVPSLLEGWNRILNRVILDLEKSKAIPLWMSANFPRALPWVPADNYQRSFKSSKVLVKSNRQEVSWNTALLRPVEMWYYLITEAQGDIQPGNCIAVAEQERVQCGISKNNRSNCLQEIGMPIMVWSLFSFLYRLWFYPFIGILRVWFLNWSEQIMENQGNAKMVTQDSQKVQQMEESLTVGSQTGLESHGDQSVPKMQNTMAVVIENEETLRKQPNRGAMVLGLKDDTMRQGMGMVAGNQVVEFTMEDVASGMQGVKLSLLGRLFIENPPSLAVIHKIVTGAWNCKVQVMEAEMGLLQFFFYNEADRDWVLQRSPWPVRDRVLHLQQWAPITRELVNSFEMIPFWVQMWNIPSHCRTVAFGRRVAGAKIGEVLDAGVFAIKGEPSHFLKAKVKVNVFEPLRSQVYASNDQIGEFWVTLVYEFLPLFCYHCGRLGHKAPHCSFPDPEGEEHYGPELSTDIIGHRLDEQTKIPVHLLPAMHKTVWLNPAVKVGGVGNIPGNATSLDAEGGGNRCREGEFPKVSLRLKWRGWSNLDIRNMQGGI
ncbi:unnamed protein product [Linum trigynum]|uniref:CCHC-type domain-containing protein n=1 Tax=Linum trigynum TaxID=586398 RepID=A0AAV2D627_9ROSI